MTIYSGFSHWKRWFSLVMLVYQRVFCFFFRGSDVPSISLWDDGPSVSRNREMLTRTVDFQDFHCRWPPGLCPNKKNGAWGNVKTTERAVYNNLYKYIYMLCISYNYVCIYIYICTHIRIIICTSMCIHILYILHIYILFYNIIYYCIILSNSEKCIGNQKCGATLHHHLDLQHFCLSILRHWKIFLI